MRRTETIDVRIPTGLANGARLVERLESQDALGRRLAYAMLDTGGVPIADYRGKVVVSASGPGVCFVRFSCVCSPVGLTEAEWRTTWTAMQVANVAFIRSRTTSLPAR